MFDWLKRNKEPEQQKESRAGQAIFTGTQGAKWVTAGDKISAKQYAFEGYQKNVIAYQAINKRADSVAALSWIARTPSGEVLDNHPFLQLIENPNPMQSRSEFIRALIGFFSISGNGYIERVLVRNEPRELYALRSDRMTVKPSATGFPAGYRYQVGQDYRDWQADPITGISDIRHLKSFNPLDDWYGMSPLMAGAYAVDQHNESMAWIQALLQNSAAPSGMLEYTGDSGLTDDEFNRLKAEIDEKFSGARNAGRPIVGEHIKWQQMGLSPVDLAIIETKYSAARDISLALGVPPLLLNIPGDSTYSNYREARLAFYEETVIPLAEYVRDELNAWLSPFFGGVELDIDLDQIPAIAEKRMELWSMADAATDLTINERRALKGYDDIAGGDELLVNAGLIPLSFADLPTDTGSEPVQLGDDGPALLKAIAYGETKNFAPPKGVQEAAQQGLDYRREYGRGGTEVGIARARDLSNGRSVSLETINRMVSFFARHEENRVPPSERTLPDGGPTNGWIAWQLWGGDAGRAWANRISDQEDGE